jgi:hypothetical protein
MSDILRKLFDDIIPLPPLTAEQAEYLFLDEWRKIAKDRAGSLELMQGQPISAVRTFTEGVLPLIRASPRDIFRLLQSLGDSFQRLGDDIDPIDLVAMETICTFFPREWSSVANAKDTLFYGEWQIGSRSGARRAVRLSSRRRHSKEKNPGEELQEELGAAGFAFPINDALTILLSRLSPRFSSWFYKTPVYSDGFQGQFLSEGRICHPSNYELYLLSAYNKDRMGNGAVRIFLNTLCESENGAREVYASYVSNGGLAFLARLHAAAMRQEDRSLRARLAGIVASYSGYSHVGLFLTESTGGEAARIGIALTSAAPRKVDWEAAADFIKQCQDPVLAKTFFDFVTLSDDSSPPPVIPSAFLNTYVDQLHHLFEQRGPLIKALGFAEFVPLCWSWHRADKGHFARSLRLVADVDARFLPMVLIAAYGQLPPTDEVPIDRAVEFLGLSSNAWILERLANISSFEFIGGMADALARMREALARHKFKSGG